MNEREKAVKGLECCINIRPGMGCKICPYHYKPSDCDRDVILDAIRLLKPRVLTLEEAIEADICWAEANGVEMIIPTRLYDNGGTVTLRKLIADPEEVPRDEYGVTWRCWTARPTREERKAAAWLLKDVL